MARKRAEDYADKREAILDRAARLFADHGFDRASMSALAAACGVSKALLYHYYDSKEALLFDVIDGHLAHLVAVVEAAEAPGLPPRDRLAALIRALLRCYADAGAQHKVQINHLSALPPDLAEALRRRERRLVQIFAAALAAAAPGRFSGEGARLLKPATMALFGILNWHYMWHRPGGPLSRDDFADLATTLILDGATGLPAAAPPWEGTAP